MKENNTKKQVATKNMYIVLYNNLLCIVYYIA